MVMEDIKRDLISLFSLRDELKGIALQIRELRAASGMMRDFALEMGALRCRRTRIEKEVIKLASLLWHEQSKERLERVRDVLSENAEELQEESKEGYLYAADAIKKHFKDPSSGFPEF
jgi:hypothetical protein